MADEASTSIADQLLAPSKVRAETRRRNSPDEFKNINPLLQQEHEADGWILEKRLKRQVKMRREKPHDVKFEDVVWATFASLDFGQLNAKRDFRLQYGRTAGESQQIDVFAADDDVVLVIECKSTDEKVDGKRPTVTFKTEVEAIQGRRAGIIKSIKSEFPNHKIKFVLATNNFNITPATRERIEEADISLLDDDAIDYYRELGKHLGKAARFQLLGNLFEGQKIPGLDSEVAALEAQMGAHRYYSFVIEPSRLLKLAYILHRNRANQNSMPTYQRLIKRPRLKKVSEFVDEGGFFPNSLVLNITTGKKRKGLRFDRSGSVGNAKIGTLYLPQVYRAAYVIDGQHRLYGFADSRKADSELIPVVAFIDLPRSEQVRLFMEINENQKAVPKNLRNTLNIDLLWDSDNLVESARALRLRIAEALEETKDSPLAGRILLGEETQSQLRCIGMDAIQNGLSRGNFIGKFTSKEVKKAGTFYRGSNDKTLAALTPFLELCFWQLRRELPEQWGIGRAGFVFVNSGVEAYLRILSDIVDHLSARGAIDTSSDSPEEIFAKVKPYIAILTDYLGNVDAEEAATLRKYGSGGPAGYWRRLQMKINDARPDFAPGDFTEYKESLSTEFNTAAYEVAMEIERFLKTDIRRKLERAFGAQWLVDGLPPKVHEDAAMWAVRQTRELGGDEEAEPWDGLMLPDYEKILQHNSKNWDELFAETYTPPGEDWDNKSWRKKSAWIGRMVPIRNKIAHDRPVTEDELNELLAIRAWLVEN